MWQSSQTAFNVSGYKPERFETTLLIFNYSFYKLYMFLM